METDTDEAFVQAFLQGVIPAGGIHHLDNLRLAWVVLQQDDLDGALSRVRAGIQAMAIQTGQTTRYHETFTRFWVRLIAQEMQQHPDCVTFEEFLTACPHLMDRNLPYRYWSLELCWSSTAREEWVEPDREQLPESL